jgi:hypothetical protein
VKPEPDLTSELDAAEDIVMGRRELLGYAVVTYDPHARRPFIGFLLPSQEEAGSQQAQMSTGSGERHVVAEVFAVEAPGEL